MSDSAAGDDAVQTRAILDLTMRLAEVIFSAGAGAEDATAAMQAITRAYGLKTTDADITHTLLTLTHENVQTHESVSRSRNVKYRNLDYAKLAATSALIGEIIERKLDVASARKRIATIVSAKPQVPWVWRRIGWSLVGAGAAFIATFVVDFVTSRLASRRVPVFYQSVAGGAIGPIAAALVQLFDPGESASIVVVATIIMLLAGVTTFGAVHDTLSGFYVTGTARLMEALLITAGLVAGVAGASLLLGRLGLDLTIEADATASFATLPTQLAASVVIVIGFGLAVQVPWRSFWAICVLGALAELVYVLGFGAGFGRVWSSAAAAIVVGLVAAIASRVVRMPPLAIVVSALVPLVPGLILFQGLLQLADGQLTGILSMLSAAGVAGALAAGAILGQYLVQAVWGPARRLQRRFIGPLMAMPVQFGRRADRGTAGGATAGTGKRAGKRI
ncbi:MAG: threonine/serine exporter family protein [Microbacteriaceae bacterium]|nr:MAG: threonine/serine exporter family protein [Microbacteriaceae bacterium]